MTGFPTPVDVKHLLGSDLGEIVTVQSARAWDARTNRVRLRPSMFDACGDVQRDEQEGGATFIRGWLVVRTTLRRYDRTRRWSDGVGG